MSQMQYPRSVWEGGALSPSWSKRKIPRPRWDGVGLPVTQEAGEASQRGVEARSQWSQTQTKSPVAAAFSTPQALASGAPTSSLSAPSSCAFLPPPASLLLIYPCQACAAARDSPHQSVPPALFISTLPEACSFLWVTSGAEAPCLTPSRGGVARSAPEQQFSLLCSD